MDAIINGFTVFIENNQKINQGKVNDNRLALEHEISIFT